MLDDNIWCDFYLMINRFLDEDQKCKYCDDRIWVVYSDGHVWETCLSCNNPLNVDLDLAAYVTRYPLPETSVPEDLEYQDLSGKNFDTHEEHELRAYRKKNNTGR